MNYRKAIFFGLLTSATFIYADTAWTLDACLKQAKEKSLKLESAKLREQQADISVKQANIDRYPSLSANINNSLHDHPFVDGPKDHYSFSVGLNGSMTLWNGGATTLSIEASQLNKQAAVYTTQQTELSIQESVLNAYMSLLAANENLHTANASVELAQAEFEHYNKLFDAGAITKKDLTQSQSNVLQKQASQLTAQLSVNTAKTTLRQLLELDADAAFEISAPEASIASPDSLPALPKYEDLTQESRKVNPGLKADSISIRAAKKNTELAGKNNSITVTLGASANSGFSAWESDRYGRQLKNGYQHSISLGINIPIIDRGATENKVLSAQVNEAETQLALKEADKTLENNLEKLYLNALSADMQWKAAVLQVEAEQEALQVAEEQRNAGAITYTDFLTQKNNLEKAQVTLTNAKYTSLLARKLIDLYQGKLN